MIAFIRSFRPLALVFAAAVVTVLGLAITALVWVDSYQPLAYGGASVYPPIASRSRGGPFAQNNVAFRQGRRFKVGLSVVNNGRFTVRVLGVSGEFDRPLAWLPVSHRRVLASGPFSRSARQWVRPYRKFRPFDLPPGQAMFLQLNGTYDAPCRPVKGIGESYSFGGFQVRYGFLWHKGKAQIDLPANLSIDVPKNEHCSGGPPP